MFDRPTVFDRSTGQRLEARRIGRREFLLLTAGFAGLAGAAMAVRRLTGGTAPVVAEVPLIDLYAPLPVDLTAIAPGDRMTVTWGGDLVYIAHRAPEDIASARAGDLVALPNFELDAARAPQEQWLVVTGQCTNEGCLLLGQGMNAFSDLYGCGVTEADLARRGDFGGWLCECCGSHYDTSGRVRAGPAPRNLAIPPHRFEGAARLIVGTAI